MPVICHCCVYQRSAASFIGSAASLATHELCDESDGVWHAINTLNLFCVQIHRLEALTDVGVFVLCEHESRVVLSDSFVDGRVLLLRAEFAAYSFALEHRLSHAHVVDHALAQVVGPF